MAWFRSFAAFALACAVFALALRVRAEPRVAVDVLEDPSRTVGYPDVMGARFVPLQPAHFNIGYSSSAFWLRCLLIASFAKGESSPAAQKSQPPKSGAQVLAPRGNFRQIRVTLLGLTSAKVEFVPCAGGLAPVKYRILRGSTVIEEIPATSVRTSGTYIDKSLRDNTAYSYSVQAIGAPQKNQAIPEAGPGSAHSTFSNPNPMLATSDAVTVTTPALTAPAWIAAAPDPVAANTLVVTWPSAPVAQSYTVPQCNRYRSLDISREGQRPRAGLVHVHSAERLPGTGWRWRLCCQCSGERAHRSVQCRGHRRLGDVGSGPPVEFNASHSFAAPQSWLWSLPVSPLIKDEVYDARAAACHGQLPSEADHSPKCSEAAVGHPNVAGAKAYSDTLTSALGLFIPEWKRTHASSQKSP
jgi:hypothetical protein